MKRHVLCAGLGTAAAVLGMSGLASGVGPVEPTTPVLRVEREDGSELIVVLPGHYRFGAEAGDTIVVRFPGSDGLEEDYFLGLCDNWGGRLLWTEMFDSRGEFVCDGLDF